jgi:hypothetical protein
MFVTCMSRMHQVLTVGGAPKHLQILVTATGLKFSLLNLFWNGEKKDYKTYYM